MRRTYCHILLLICLLVAKSLSAQWMNDSVFQKKIIASFQFKDPVYNASATLKEQVSKESMIAFLFLSPECPLCQNYMPLLNTLQVKLGDWVKLIGIVPGKTYSSIDVNAFKKKYKGCFPLFIDTQKKFVSYLRALATPEVVLLDKDGNLVYRGAIDNRLNKLGERRVNISENYLSDAIAQYQKDKRVTVKRRKAIGCTINDF